MRIHRYITTLPLVSLAGCGGEPPNEAPSSAPAAQYASLSVPSTGDLLLDDFNDSNRYGAGKNALGFSTGDDGTMKGTSVINSQLRLDFVNGAGYWYSAVNPAGRHIENFRWLQFHARGAAGDEKLQLVVKDAANRAYAVELDPLKLSSEVRYKPVSAFAGVDLTKAKSVLLRPASASGTVFIDDLKLKGVGNRDLYVWDIYDPAQQRNRTPDELAAFCDQQAVRELYLKLDLSKPAQVASYLPKLHARGLRVHFLGGDPSWGYDNKRGLARMAQLIDYNDNQAKDSTERFDGANFDVEWYLPPHNNTDKAGYDGWIELFRQWRTMLKNSGPSSTLQLGASIPCWLEPTSDHSFTNPRAIQSITDYVTVMAYRDDADGIADAVATEVQNARELGNGLVIAIEFSDFKLGRPLTPKEAKQTFCDQSLAEFDAATEQVVASVRGEFPLGIHNIEYYDKWLQGARCAASEEQ